MPLPRSLANIKREISEKKWTETRQWAGAWRPDLRDEVPNAEKPEAGRHGIWEHQEASLAGLPDQGGALTIRAVPQLHEELAHPTVLAVPVPEPYSGAPPEWGARRKILWAEVRKETRR